MNERIQELSYQCWYKDPDTGKEEFNRTKFAELIVRECAGIFEGIYTDQQRPERIDIRIKKHFGVEE